MSLDRDDEQRIKSYLLGELAQAELRELEERLLREEEFANQVLLIEDELIEGYALGELSSEEQQQFKKYFLTSPRRRRKLMMVERLKQRAMSEPQAIVEGPVEQSSAVGKAPNVRMIKEPTGWTRLFQPRWKLAAFATLILVAGLGAWRAFVYQSPVDRGLVALNAAYKQERPLVARVVGISYAPHSGKRGGDPANVDYRSRDLSRSLLLGAASDNPNAVTLHALGRSYLMQKEFDKAVLDFQEALKYSPDDPELHADLGAALLEQAKVFRDHGEKGKAMERLAESQQHLSAALRQNPSLLEALFNRALVLEELMLREQAKEAWKKYLDLDPNSEWAKDARRRLEEVSEFHETSSTPEELLAVFMTAFRARNDNEAWRVMSANREVITGKMIPLRLAEAYVTHTLKGEGAEAREKLNAFLFAGDLDQRFGGDPYMADLAAYYAKVSPATLQLLAKAAEDLNQGYALCLATKYDEAAARFTSAKAIFDQVGDEWEAQHASYWIAYWLTQAGRIQDSHAILETIAEYSRTRGYKWLLAMSTGWLGSSYLTQNEYSIAIRYNKQSLVLAEEISDTYQIQRALMTLGDLYARLRQPEIALGYHYRNLELAANSGAVPRQAGRNLTYFASALFAFKHYDVAALLMKEALRRTDKDPTLLYVQHLNLGQIYTKLRQFDEAIAQADIGLNIARSVQDPISRIKPVANSFLSQADIWREAGQCDKAVGNYDQAISLYEQLGLELYRYAAYKGRLLCNQALENDVAVSRDLTILLTLFERHRSQIREEGIRNSFFDAEQSVYDIAVDYEYGKQNKLAAFSHAEAAHGRSLLDAVQSGAHIEETSEGPEMAFRRVSTPANPETVRLQLPRNVRVLMYTVLQNKMLIWSISHDELLVFPKEVPADALKSQVNAYVHSLTKDLSGLNPATNSLATRLFDSLLSPVVKTIKPGEVIGIIPDKFLHRLPFAALISPDTGKYLIEEWPIFYAPSLSVLWHCLEAGRTKGTSREGRVLSVGNPLFNLKAYPELPTLRSAEKEALTISKLYDPNSSVLLGPQATKDRILREISVAEIIHFAGHYVVDESSPLLSRMLLASSENESVSQARDSDLATFEIVRQRLDHTRLVILSACQTGIDRYYEGEGAIGLARAFIAAGVPLVVASQWPVDSDATASLMINFHRYRKLGNTTTESLRKAQVDMLRGPDEAYKSPYYWAAFLSAGGYVEY